jgi:outer membrane protein assembly factor BamB
MRSNFLFLAILAVIFQSCSSAPTRAEREVAETLPVPPEEMKPVPGQAVSLLTRWVSPARIPKWEMRPHERTRPVVMGDILYFATLSGEVQAVHRHEGYVLWKKQMPSGVEGALTYARSKLFVGDTSGNLVALNARDGSEAWRFKIAAEWLSPPAVLRDKLFIASSNDEIYALAENTGKELWHYSHRGDEKMTIRGTSGPALYGGELYQGFSDGYLVGLSANQGRVLWEKRLRHKERFYDVDMVPHVDDQSVIAATFDGRLYSLDRLTGDTKWMFPVGSYGGILVESESVYLAGLNGEFYALDRSGQLKWKTAFKEGIGLTPSRVGEYLVVTTSSDPVYLLDPADGKILSREWLGAGTLAPAAAAGDNWFYILSNYGVLYSYEILPGFNPKRGPATIPTPSAIQRNRVPSKESNTTAS